MRLLLKRGHSLVNDQHFSKGPVCIGRRPKSHVFLPDRAVSRQHAVLLLIICAGFINWTLLFLAKTMRKPC